MNQNGNNHHQHQNTAHSFLCLAFNCQGYYSKQIQQTIMAFRQDDFRKTIVELLTPALPILPQEDNRIYSLYNNLEELPDFTHKDEEEFELQLLPSPLVTTQSLNTYPIYSRKTLEKYNFATKEKQYAPEISIVDSQQHVLKFESNFQSGNLQRVDKVQKKDSYQLILQNDINTSGYTQWFFFSIEGGVKDVNYKFSIINCYRDASLYEQGMKILIYSSKGHEINKKAWYRGGQKIKYFHQNRRIQTKPGSSRALFTLSFNYKWQFQSDKVYFAYNYPYTVKDLHNDIEGLDQRYVRRTLLCRTLAENRVEMLTITNPQSKKKKNGIIMTARVHPSETVSSYVIKGVMQFLVSDDEVATELRDNFIFKIVPMVNPDGVIHGHSRTNLSGRDLNRVWINPDQKLHSEIYYLKKNIIQFSKRCPISMYCDFHGHSKKKNAFLYGCSDKQIPYKSRQFPYLYSKALSTISYKNCSFHIKKDKAGTARAVLWKSLKTHDIFTLETSSCGPSDKNIHFSYKHFEQIGRKFCMTLLLHLSQNQNSQNSLMLRQIHGIYLNRNKILRQLYSKKTLLTTEDQSSNSDTSQQDCYQPQFRSTNNTIKKILLRSQTKPKTQALMRQKQAILTKRKSKLNFSLERRKTQKSEQTLISLSAIIKPKLFSMEETQISPSRQKEKSSKSIFKSRQSNSFFCKPLRMRTIQPPVQHFVPGHRKNISSMDWTIQNVSQVDLAQKQLLLKTRKSFFDKVDFSNHWRQTTFNNWKQ